MKGKRPPESFVYWWSAVEKRGLGKEIKYCDLDEYIGHWRLVVEVKQVKKVKRKRSPTQHWSNAQCISISLLHIPQHDRHITTKIPLKESKESVLWCSRPLPSSHRSPLHFSQPLVLHRWGEVGVRDEKLSGLNSGFCMGTFSSGWSLHPGTFSSVWSLDWKLLTQGSLNYTCRFTI